MYGVFTGLSAQERDWQSHLLVRQTANGRFKLRISQNSKWSDKNSLKQFLWMKITWNYLCFCRRSGENAVTLLRVMVPWFSWDPVIRRQKHPIVRNFLSNFSVELNFSWRIPSSQLQGSRICLLNAGFSTHITLSKTSTVVTGPNCLS